MGCIYLFDSTSSRRDRGRGREHLKQTPRKCGAGRRAWSHDPETPPKPKMTVGRLTDCTTQCPNFSFFFFLNAGYYIKSFRRNCFIWASNSVVERELDLELEDLDLIPLTNSVTVRRPLTFLSFSLYNENIALTACWRSQ